METKRLHVEMKSEDEGVVLAKFATLGVKDHDGDLIEPGAFGAQKVKVSAYGHASWGAALPVGVGVTKEDGDAALAELQFFLNTTHGRDHFETVKGLGELGEWSFGFDVLEEAAPTEEQRQAGVFRVLKKLKVFEVSPVLRGAGVDTQTVSVKCDACAARNAPPPEPVVEEPESTEEPPVVEDVEPEAKGEERDLRDEIMAEVGRYEILSANKPSGL